MAAFEAARFNHSRTSPRREVRGLCYFSRCNPQHETRNRFGAQPASGGETDLRVEPLDRCQTMCATARQLSGLEGSTQAAARPTCASSRVPQEHTERSWRKIFSGLERSDSKKQKRRRFRRRSCKNTASKPI